MVCLALLAVTIGVAAAGQEPSPSPGVDELVARHIQALGGLENLKAVQTVRMSGRAVLAGQAEAPLTLFMKRPSKSRLEFNYQGQIVVQAFDGATGWMLLPMRTPSVERATPEEAAKMKQSSDFDSVLVDYAAKGYRVEAAGAGEVAGLAVWKLKVIRGGGETEYVDLDRTTWLAVKTSVAGTDDGKEQWTETYLSDYRKTGSVMMPFAIDQRVAGRSVMRMILDNIELNLLLPDSLFSIPAEESR